MTSSPTPLSHDSRPTSDLDTPRATPKAFQREAARDVIPELPHDTRPTSALMSTLPSSPAERRSAMGLSFAGVAGSSLAAVSSALAASFLGVAGTIAGALVGSLVGTVGTAVYSHSLQTAGTRLRALTPSQKLAPVETSGQPSGGPREVHGALRSDQPSRRRPLLMIATGVAVAFVVAIGAITLAETVLGHPVSSSGGGTTIGRVVTPQGSGSEPSGTTPSPAVTTSTSGQTAPPTGVTTPPPTTATGSATGSSSTSASGSATDTGSSTTPAPSGSASTQVPATP